MHSVEVCSKLLGGRANIVGGCVPCCGTFMLLPTLLRVKMRWYFLVWFTSKEKCTMHALVLYFYNILRGNLVALSL